MTKIPSVEAFWKMLEATQFVKTANSITDKVEEHPPAIQDMEAIIAIHGEFDKYAIDDWLTQALQAQRDAGAEEEREKWIKAVGEKIDKTTRELMLSAFQEGVAVTRAQYNEAIKSITPPTK